MSASHGVSDRDPYMGRNFAWLKMPSAESTQRSVIENLVPCAFHHMRGSNFPAFHIYVEDNEESN
jgi:hypothetical protein